MQHQLESIQLYHTHFLALISWGVQTARLRAGQRVVSHVRLNVPFVSHAMRRRATWFVMSDACMRALDRFIVISVAVRLEGVAS